MKTFFEAVIGIVAVTAIIMILIVFFFGGNRSAYTRNNDTSAAASSVSSASAAVSAQTTDTQSGTTIEQTKQYLLDVFLSLGIDASDVSVSEIDTLGTRYTLTYTLNESAWNESNLLAKAFSYYIRFCQLAYAQGDYVIVVMKTNYMLSDSRGNEYVDLAVRTGMYKDVFMSYNWDAFSYLPIYDAMQADCYDFWVLPGIMQNIDKEDVYFIME